MWTALKNWLSRTPGYGGKGDESGRKLEPYLADGNACALLRLVLENPGITTDTLAIRAHVGADTAAACIKKLSDDGIVVSDQAGHHIATAAKAAVVERLPLHYQCPGLRRE